jgi:mono/diheme cytochrome c family protein
MDLLIHTTAEGETMQADVSDERQTRRSRLVLDRAIRMQVACIVAVLGAGAGVVACNDAEPVSPPARDSKTVAFQRTEPQNVTDGQRIFRYETFGDEKFWTDTLQMNKVIEQVVSPAVALSVGLKVDADALPTAVVEAIRENLVDLNDPATTALLLKLDAVVGVKAQVDDANHITRVGITCALCHSTVDNSFAPGIGKRLDGYPNRDLNPGAIIALSPALTDAQKAVYNSWGKGRYDPRFNFDGKNGPVPIPPAYGLEGVHSVTVTGDGPNLMYWNRYVAVTQRHGQGNFSEPRLDISIHQSPDLVARQLGALQAYQLSLQAPPPPPGSFDRTAAARGRVVFDGVGQCSSCHTGSTFTDANVRLHDPAKFFTDPSYALRSATKMWRTAPLRGVWQHPPYFHDGSSPTLADVVDRYDANFHLGLTPQQKADLVQYLLSL